MGAGDLSVALVGWGRGSHRVVVGVKKGGRRRFLLPLLLPIHHMQGKCGQGLSGIEIHRLSTSNREEIGNRLSQIVNWGDPGAAPLLPIYSIQDVSIWRSSSVVIVIGTVVTVDLEIKVSVLGHLKS